MKMNYNPNILYAFTNVYEQAHTLSTHTKHLHLTVLKSISENKPSLQSSLIFTTSGEGVVPKKLWWGGHWLIRIIKM